MEEPVLSFCGWSTAAPLPPPSVEELDACFVVHDHNGQKLALCLLLTAYRFWQAPQVVRSSLSKFRDSCFSRSRLLRRGVLASLICRRCAVRLKSHTTRCPHCGVLSPTSKLGAALLTPSAFAFGTLVALLAAIWFW
jgi:ribosomal protein L40E